MLTPTANGIRALIESTVTAISVLGGAMAYESGLAAAEAMSEDQPSAVLAERVNEGLGDGFSWGRPAALLAFIILAWI